MWIIKFVQSLALKRNRHASKTTTTLKKLTVLFRYCRLSRRSVFQHTVCFAFDVYIYVHCILRHLLVCVCVCVHGRPEAIRDRRICVSYGLVVGARCEYSCCTSSLMAAWSHKDPLHVLYCTYSFWIKLLPSRYKSDCWESYQYDKVVCSGAMTIPVYMLVCISE